MTIPEIFQGKLIDWKAQLIIELDHTITDLKNKHMQEPDENDRASAEKAQVLSSEQESVI